jgi:multifunctional 2-oxoglutarate metabolism enzyme
MTDQETSRQFGTNMWLVDEMYRDYLANPDSVGESWKEFFSDYSPSTGGTAAPRPTPPQATAANGAATARSERDERAAEPAEAPAGKAEGNGRVPDDAKPLRGVASTIAENMVQSLAVPTATSIRSVPAKLLEVNRKIINNQLVRTRGGKVSFTHLIGWAIVRAMAQMPVMTSVFHEADGKAYVRRPEQVNLGLAMDIEKKDGSRTLLVPNIKDVHSLDFAGFFRAYEEVVRKVRTNELSPELFADTTATLTNPGTVGTVGSVPRLMPGQSVIIGVGAIDYPSEYQATDPRTLAEIGVGKVITMTSTYDHRVIQGAESGLFLKAVHELLLGGHDFYDDIFNSLAIPYAPVRWLRDENPGLGSNGRHTAEEKQVAVQRLIRQYRVRGHLIANLNPLSHTFQQVHPELDPATYGLTIWDLDREFATGGLAGRDRMTLGAILGVLRDAYCRTVGVEYMHIQEPDQTSWIQRRVEGVKATVEPEEQRTILSRLNAAEAFERFLHTKYLGQKRFSLEGAESTIAMLGALLDAAADDGISKAVMGMAHRGRLNVLANILHKSHNKIFREFEGNIDPESIQGSGDVKYHLGTVGTHKSGSGATIEVELSSNPSHLEAVNPVVAGMARAKLDEMGAAAADLDHHTPVLPILLHGDAAFAGQGVVPETLAMSQLRGYRVGGTVHLIINNQVGFTTPVESARSSTYSTDVAKAVQAPIFHVNGDDPEACARVMRLAFEFRQEFGKDVVVDLVCYRRHGHNEGDDPSYTQPHMYAAIENRRSVRKLYTEELVMRGDLTLEEAEQAMDEFRDVLEHSLQATRESAPPAPEEVVRRPERQGLLDPIETGVDRDTLERIIAEVTSAPEGFTVHPKLAKQLEKRRAMLDEDRVDWAMGESFAFGSLLLAGHPVRLAGQDSRRGTFSQRHSVLIDHETAEEHTPLNHLAEDQAPFMVYDSLLSEYAAMGFEYGYSVVRKDALTMWEAQFGDFVNGAQIIIDQFLVAAEDKWGQTSGLTLLLPHGYEGQGPEHSSARLERFLVLCAEDNIQVTQPTNAAQYFHLLRRQVLRDIRKPLVVLTPKGLLRAKPAMSPAEAFTSGSFRETLRDEGAPDGVRRVLLCSGRVAFDLIGRRDAEGHPAAIVRVEQLYPTPLEQIREAIESYGDDVTDVVWVQDEPENMGAWPFMHLRLHRLLRDDYELRHVSRYESASPATGSAAVHEREQEDLLDRAFEGL